MAVTRTKRTIQNSKVSLIFFLIQIFIGFYSRKIFLDYLGDEVIGLNTTLGNILSFLNLAELGIGMAMATSLYKPIHNKDYKTITEIITVQGILYKKIALFLCIISVPILIALPIIFPSVECGLLYIYIAYIVFLSNSIFSYLWNYRQILIQADQKDFKLTPWIHSVRFCKIFVQIFILTLTPLGIWGWISTEFAGNVVTVFVINRTITKEYPWLQKSSLPTDILIQKYKTLLIKVKQLFAHKIGAFVLHQTSPLIIYAFVSLNMVTYYSNYMMLIGYFLTLMNVIFGGMSASIGNLIAENNKPHTICVFWELFTSRIWIAGISCFVVYVFIGPFISIWIGSKYVLEENTLLLLLTTMFIQISRTVIESFKDAYQLFADVWSPIVESLLNLGSSIFFGYLYGLNGVLIGVNFSLIIIVLLWKPYYTFKYGLKTAVKTYYINYVLHVTILIAGGFLSKYVIDEIYYNGDSLFSLIAVSTLGVLIYIISTYITLFIFTNGMRMFTYRIRNILLRKI